MVNKSIIIAIVILIIALGGFFFFSNMTGNVITGSSINQEEIQNNYFKIDDSDNKRSIEGSIGNAQDINQQG